MLGSIIGDVAGSYYEILESRARKDQRIRPYEEKMQIMDPNTKLFTEKSRVTDDSILTTAIADAILSNEDYEQKLKEYGNRELDFTIKRFNKGGFGKRFINWLQGDYIGDSYGNGAAMRISPVGNLFDNIDLIKLNTVLATANSHNSDEAILGALAVSTSIYYLNHGFTKEELEKYIRKNFYNLDFDLDKLRKTYTFSSRTNESVPQAIFCFLKSDSFESAIRTAISIGGDSDTIASITGSLAESYYGLDRKLVEEVKPYLRDYMLPVIDKFYNKKVKVYERNSRKVN